MSRSLTEGVRVGEVNYEPVTTFFMQNMSSVGAAQYDSSQDSAIERKPRKGIGATSYAYVCD